MIIFIFFKFYKHNFCIKPRICSYPENLEETRVIVSYILQYIRTLGNSDWSLVLYCGFDPGNTKGWLYQPQPLLFLSISPSDCNFHYVCLWDTFIEINNIYLGGNISVPRFWYCHPCLNIRILNLNDNCHAMSLHTLTGSLPRHDDHPGNSCLLDEVYA